MSHTPHFFSQALTDQVYAALAQDGGAAISNAGVIDLGGLTVIFDTFLTLQAARDLRSFAEKATGRSPQIVINSHFHNDHIWGNQVFLPEAQFVSTNEARQLMITEGMEEYRWYSAKSAQKLASLQAEFNATQDVIERRRLLLWIGYYSGLVETLPRLELTLPGITFDRRLELHGTKRRAELITFEGAHTGSDTILYLPQDGIVFTSDLLFIGNHPYLAEGNPYKLLDTLHELSRMDAAIYVPGHGPVGSREDLFLMIEYVEHCLAVARSLVNDGGDYEAGAKQMQPGEAFMDWQLSGFYPTNILSFCRLLTAQTG